MKTLLCAIIYFGGLATIAVGLLLVVVPVVATMMSAGFRLGIAH